jgi:hypothetical protein
MLCKTCISSRLKVGILGTIACSLVYSLRVNLSVAIVAMVNQTMIERRHPKDTCSDDLNDTYSNNYPVSYEYVFLSQQINRQICKEFMR